MLHRNIRKILAKLRAIDDTRKILRKQQLLTEATAVARHMVKSGLFRKASYDFNSIIALGQFVTLGMVLVASLSAIYSVVAELDDGYRETKGKAINGKMKVEKELKQGADVDDLGEEILDLVTPSVEAVKSVNLDELFKNKGGIGKKQKSEYKVLKEPREKDKRKKEKKEKKKKDKKRNAIDDIFG